MRERILMGLSAALVALVAGCKSDEQKLPPPVSLSERAAGIDAAPRAHPSAHPSVSIVAGTIRVAEQLAGQLPAGATLFIVGRPLNEDGTPGPAALVKKAVGVTLPYAFTLGTDDMMLQGLPMPKRLVVQARFDQDGDAISRTPGDIAGQTKQAVESGAPSVELVLDELIKEDKPPMPVR